MQFGIGGTGALGIVGGSGEAGFAISFPIPGLDPTAKFDAGVYANGGRAGGAILVGGPGVTFGAGSVSDLRGTFRQITIAAVDVNPTISSKASGKYDSVPNVGSVEKGSGDIAAGKAFEIKGIGKLNVSSLLKAAINIATKSKIGDKTVGVGVAVSEVKSCAATFRTGASCK